MTEVKGILTPLILNPPPPGSGPPQSPLHRSLAEERTISVSARGADLGSGVIERQEGL